MLDSRIPNVDPGVNLMEVFGGPAVKAAVVRQQVVQLLHRNLEAVRLHPPRRVRLRGFALHPRRGVKDHLQQTHLDRIRWRAWLMGVRFPG